jgi:hypothetical protein
MQYLKRIKSWSPGETFWMLFVSAEGSGKYHEGKVKGERQKQEGDRWYGSGSEWNLYEVLWEEDGVWSVSEGFETASPWEMLSKEQMEAEKKTNKRARLTEEDR